MASQVLEWILQARDEASATIKSFGASVQQSNSKMAASVDLSKKMAVGVAGVGLAAGAAGLQALKAAGEHEQLEVAFTTMLGSADKAQSLLSDIAGFAASTPFELTEVQKGSKALLAFGVDAEKIIPSMKNIGDIAAGVGAPIDELAVLFGKARTAGTLYSEDINQLTERGIPIIAQLAEQFGVAESEIKKMASEGKIGFEDLEEAFASMSGEGGQFYNLMEAQSGTLLGQWSNLQDGIHQLMIGIGQQLLPVAVQFVGVLNETVIPAITMLAQWLMENQNVVAAVAIGIAAMLVPAFVSWGIAAGAAAIATIAASWPLLALGAAVAAVAYLILNHWEDIKRYFEMGKEFIKKAIEVIIVILGMLFPPFALLVRYINQHWDDIVAAFQAGKEWITKIINGIVDWLSGKISEFRDWGSKIGGAFVEGFKEALNRIKQAAIDAFNSAKDFMQGNSPPIAGPLKNIDVWGYNIGTAWIDGFREAIDGGNILNGLPNALSGLNQPAPTFAGGGSVTTVSNPVTINNTINTELDMTQVNQELAFIFQDRGRY